MRSTRQRGGRLLAAQCIELFHGLDEAMESPIRPAGSPGVGAGQVRARRLQTIRGHDWTDLRAAEPEDPTEELRIENLLRGERVRAVGPREGQGQHCILIDDLPGMRVIPSVRRAALLVAAGVAWLARRERHRVRVRAGSVQIDLTGVHDPAREATTLAELEGWWSASDMAPGAGLRRAFEATRLHPTATTLTVITSAAPATAGVEFGELAALFSASGAGASGRRPAECGAELMVLVAPGDLQGSYVRDPLGWAASCCSVRRRWRMLCQRMESWHRICNEVGAEMYVLPAGGPSQLIAGLAALVTET